MRPILCVGALTMDTIFRLDRLPDGPGKVIPLDAVENLAMLRMVDHGASDALAKLATWCAGLKFTVLLAAVGYLLTVGTATLIQRLLPH